MEKFITAVNKHRKFSLAILMSSEVNFNTKMMIIKKIYTTTNGRLKKKMQQLHMRLLKTHGKCELSLI